MQVEMRLIQREANSYSDKRHQARFVQGKSLINRHGPRGRGIQAHCIRLGFPAYGGNDESRGIFSLPSSCRWNVCWGAIFFFRVAGGRRVFAARRQCDSSKLASAEVRAGLLWPPCRLLSHRVFASRLWWDFIARPATRMIRLALALSIFPSPTPFMLLIRGNKKRCGRHSGLTAAGVFAARRIA